MEMLPGEPLESTALATLTKDTDHGLAVTCPVCGQERLKLCEEPDKLHVGRISLSARVPRPRVRVPGSTRN